MMKYVRCPFFLFTTPGAQKLSLSYCASHFALKHMEAALQAMRAARELLTFFSGGVVAMASFFLHQTSKQRSQDAYSFRKVSAESRALQKHTFDVIMSV